FGEEGWEGKRWLRPSLKFCLYSTVSVLLFMSCWAFLWPHDSIERAVLLFLSIVVVMQVSIELVGAIFQLEEKYQGLSLWLLSPHVIRVLCLLPLLILGLSELKVAAAYGIAALMVFAIGGTKILKAASGNIE